MPEIQFTTTVSAFGRNTGIVVPPEVIDQLGAGKRPAVQVEVNGYGYETTVGVMGGQQLISISAAVRAASGLAAGDEVEVTLRLSEAPRKVEVPNDLAVALAAEPAAGAFFASLSNSLQRYHIDNVTAAKAPATRQRRIDKAIDLFLAGKKR